MTETVRRPHPMRVAEDELLAAGLRHAPIQGFLEEDGVDGRFVTLLDEPGTYYLLGGVDNQPTPKNDKNDGKIQILFLFTHVGDDAALAAEAIAQRIGWRVEKFEALPCSGPVPVGFDPGTTIPSAILARP